MNALSLLQGADLVSNLHFVKYIENIQGMTSSFIKVHSFHFALLWKSKERDIWMMMARPVFEA